MSVELLNESDTAAWDAYVARHPRASLFHSAAWAALISNVFGHEAPYLVARGADRKLCGALPLVHIRSWLFGSYLTSLPYFTYGGPLADDAAVERELVDAAAELATQRGARHIEFRCQARFDGAWPCREEKVSLHLPLAPTVDGVWKGLSTQRRSQIKKAEKAGIELRAGGIELLDDFYGVFARNMRDLGTPVYSRRLFLAMLERFPQQSLIVTAHLAGRPIAAAFLLQHRDVLEVPWVSTVREYNHLYANTLLYWRLLQLAVERGCRTFDFGRSTRDSGTYNFKKQWGATPVQLYWHYWLSPGTAMPGLTPSNPRFAMAVRAWKRLPLGLANALGPRIVKDLP